MVRFDHPSCIGRCITLCCSMITGSGLSAKRTPHTSGPSPDHADSACFPIFNFSSGISRNTALGFGFGFGLGGGGLGFFEASFLPSIDADAEPPLSKAVT